MSSKKRDRTVMESRKNGPKDPDFYMKRKQALKSANKLAPTKKKTKRSTVKVFKDCEFDGDFASGLFQAGAEILYEVFYKSGKLKNKDQELLEKSLDKADEGIEFDPCYLAARCQELFADYDRKSHKVRTLVLRRVLDEICKNLTDADEISLIAASQSFFGEKKGGGLGYPQKIEDLSHPYKVPSVPEFNYDSGRGFTIEVQIASWDRAYEKNQKEYEAKVTEWKKRNSPEIRKAIMENWAAVTKGRLLGSPNLPEDFIRFSLTVCGAIMLTKKRRSEN